MNAARRSIALALVALVVVAAGCAPGRTRAARYGSVIGIKAESLPEYKRLHAAVWPEVLARLREAHVENYSIYLTEVRPGEYYLFSYFEYTGSDFKADMARLAADPDIKRWWTHTDPLQVPVPTRREGEWWHTGEEVFHMD